MDTHEVMNIQIGHYANFVGTHWWNMQEASFCFAKGVPRDLNHDVMFREGLNLQNETTFTPRLLVIDTKKSLGSLKKTGFLYDTKEEEENYVWDGTVDVIRQEPLEKNEYLKAVEQTSIMPLAGASPPCSNVVGSDTSQFFNMDNIVNKWSDFLEVPLHPRTICLIDESSSDDGESSFEGYGHGLQAYSVELTRNTIEDRIRQYVEECDYLQGFHVLVDGNNGFSAVGSSLLLHLDDEYHKKTSVTFPVYQNSCRMLGREEEQHELACRLHSSLLGLSNLSSVSSLVSPLTLACDLISFHGPHVNFPLLKYNDELLYHTSAVLATAIENVTVPYRLKHRRCGMFDVAESLVPFGRKLVSAGVSLPFPVGQYTKFASIIENVSPEYVLHPLTPFFQPGLHTALSQCAVLRGVPDACFQTSSATGRELSFSDFLGQYLKGESSSPAVSKVEKEEAFAHYLNKYSASSLASVTVLDERCSILPSFPRIFSEKAVRDRILLPVMQRVSEGVGSFPIVATLSNSSKAAELLDTLLLQLKQVTRSRLCEATQMQVERDEFDEVLSNLTSLKENYSSP